MFPYRLLFRRFLNSAKVFPRCLTGSRRMPRAILERPINVLPLRLLTSPLVPGEALLPMPTVIRCAALAADFNDGLRPLRGALTTELARFFVRLPKAMRADLFRLLMTLLPAVFPSLAIFL